MQYQRCLRVIHAQHVVRIPIGTQGLTDAKRGFEQARCAEHVAYVGLQLAPVAEENDCVDGVIAAQALEQTSEILVGIVCELALARDTSAIASCMRGEICASGAVRNATADNSTASRPAARAEAMSPRLRSTSERACRHVTSVAASRAWPLRSSMVRSSRALPSSRRPVRYNCLPSVHATSRRISGRPASAAPRYAASASSSDLVCWPSDAYI